MSTVAQQARAGFVDVFGAAPDGVWSAPGRVNLIGEHTDYNEGYVLPFAIDRRTAVALRARPDRRVRLATATRVGDVREAHLDHLSPSKGSGWSGYPLGVAWALLQGGADGGAVSGFDAYVSSDVPLGAGLSSSAALVCATAISLNDSWAVGLSAEQLVAVGQRAENLYVGSPTGILDQSASLLSRADSALFIDCRDGQKDHIPLCFQEAGLHVVVVDTHIAHAHSTGGYADRRRSCESGARALGVSSLRDVSPEMLEVHRARLDETTARRVRHVVTENERVLETVARLKEGSPTGIGDLLDASHVSLRDDFEVSVPQLNVAVESARRSGALGARMVGGGFGGSAIALAPRERVGHVAAEVAKEFSRCGYTKPGIFTVVADEGARRDE